MEQEEQKDMMQSEDKGPQPYDTIVNEESMRHEVQSNGDVKVIQKGTTEYMWKSSAFTSLLRQNEEALKMFKDAQSKEHLERMAKQEKAVQEVIKKLKPIVVESEKKQAEDYVKMRHEGLLKNVKSALDDQKTNYAWFQQIWLRAKDDIKKPVFDELSSEQQIKLMKILSRMKRKGIK